MPCLQSQEGSKDKDFVLIDCPGCEKCSENNGYYLRKGKFRPTTAHEYIFLFAKSETYFCDGDASQEPQSQGTVDRFGKQRFASPRTKFGNAGETRNNAGFIGSIQDMLPGGRNPRSVWSLSSEPEKAKHFATFPSAIPRKCLTAATSKAGCCPKCGACYAPVVESERVATRPGCDSKVWFVAPPESPLSDHAGSVGKRDPQRHVAVTKVNGYRPTCNCNAGEPVPCLVADIFSGSGTSGRVAYSMGLRYIGFELSEEYAAISREKIVRPFPNKTAKRQRTAVATSQRRLFA